MIHKEMTEAKHLAIFEHYDAILKELGPEKPLGPKEEEALKGAFYHAKRLGWNAPKEFFDWFLERSDPFLRVAAWKLLLSLYEEMLEFLKQNAPESLECVRILNRLAFLCRSTGKYKKALSYYEQALKLLDKLASDEPENARCRSYIAGTLNNYGVLLSELDLSEEAENSYVKALQLREKLTKNELSSDFEVARILNNLGLLYHQTGQHEKALVLLSQALEIFERLNRTKHPAYA
ncbi:MAG: tetratricopeptide repeat protein, partial [Methanosarcinaceae archaeon]|nr:tetratricopeptide repeat protein [Methanosarcinaceae archaeon]